MRRAARVDANSEAITLALRASGWLVADTARVGRGFPDKLVYRPDKGFRLVEIKRDAKDARLNAAQVEFHERWPVVVLRTPDDALELK